MADTERLSEIDAKIQAQFGLLMELDQQDRPNEIERLCQAKWEKMLALVHERREASRQAFP